MKPTLDAVETRVLGALIEKEVTTPDNYPLSLNSLVAACNQSSNRNPVVHLDESTVASAADSLREKKLAVVIDRGESRVTKYRHIFYETMNLGRPAVAVLGVLMLRGPQTLGEIRTRTGRMYDFSSLEEVETTLNSLASGETPLVLVLPRQPGQKEIRYAHLLSGEVAVADQESEKKIQRITPFLWFNNEAEDAANLYISVFKNSKIVTITRYTESAAQASGQSKGTAMTVAFDLEGQRFTALNGGPLFKFTEAISFVVACDTQDEIDHFWNRLSQGGDEKSQRCGWLKDRFGLSWQIVPRELGQMLNAGDPERLERVMQAVLQMKKLDVEALKQAYRR